MHFVALICCFFARKVRSTDDEVPQLSSRIKMPQAKLGKDVRPASKGDIEFRPSMSGFADYAKIVLIMTFFQK